jgi:hypothetical protein
MSGLIVVGVEVLVILGLFVHVTTGSIDNGVNDR